MLFWAAQYISFVAPKKTIMEMLKNMNLTKLTRVKNEIMVFPGNI